MAVTAAWYGNALLRQFNGNPVDWDTDATIKVALLASTYAPTADTYDTAVYFDDGTANDPASHEITGTGYTAGGVTLAGKTAAYDAATNETQLGATNVSWSDATFTARYAVIYNDVGASPTRGPLLGLIDFGGDQSVSSGTFTIQWAADGVLKITS